ncbi:MAG: NAD(P)/FAD-dependent oxidoreductase [Parasphingopyxis sp.]|uniref:flavin-containing monooxygenase n=1 Tax=Parasphingopyxis sp. TaxID=1920299 RepID=UPI0032EE4AEB
MTDIESRPIDGGSIDYDLLRAGVEHANIPTLLLCLVQLGGDRQWLSEEFAPTRAAGIDNHDSGGLPEDVQAQIRKAAFETISEWLAGKPMAWPRPTNKELAELLSATMAEDIPGEYGDIIAASMELEDEEPLPSPPENRSAIIIGGGISGICAAVEMQKLGLEYKLFEKNEDFGGTWWENRYPGCGVDTPNLTYTFAFRSSDFTRYFPMRHEIRDYLHATAEEFDLYANAQFETTVEKAEWLEDGRCWEVSVTTKDGQREVHRADIVFSAVGILNTPQYPAIANLDSFAGPVLHTCRWPDDLSLKGKKVAVVGNGASAMQLVPAIADTVAELTIFARSKQWAAPFPQFQKDVPEGLRYLMRVVPLYRAWFEQRLTWTFNDRLLASLYRDPKWEAPERAVNAINDRHREFFTQYIKSELGDRQDLLPQLLPDYPPYAKRMLLDNGWFRTMTKDNVRLIADRLESVDGNRLIAASGEEAEADILVFATGYKATEVLGSYDVVGRGGVLLRDYWDGDDAAAFLGTLVPGFPNFFILVGPHTGSGHGGSMIRNIENQVHYSTQIIGSLFARNAGAVEVRTDVYDDYRDEVDAAHETLIWTHPGTTNWYRNSKGRIVSITPWRNDDFWRMTRSPDPAHLNFFFEAGDKA